MKTKLFFFMIFFLLIYINFFAAENSDSEDPVQFELDSFLINHFPGGYFYPFVIENYVPDATFLIEESNGFSLIDNPRVYFEGESFINFNWNYNGFNINSALNDGSPGVILPLSTINTYKMRGESPLFDYSGMNFISEIPTKNYSQLTASTTYSDLGGYWLTFMIQPDHPETRADRLYTERRKIKSNYFLDYQLNKNFSNSQLQMALSYFNIQRNFNDFNAFNQTFQEDGELFLMNARFRKNLNQGNVELFGVFNSLKRSNHMAEIGNYPQETNEKERFSLLTGLSLNKKKFDLKLSLLFEKDDLNPTQKNFSKDLLDNDGDGIYPYGDTGELKIGKFSSIIANLKLNYHLSDGLFNLPIVINAYADARYSSITGDENIHDYNSILFDGNPYQVVIWNQGYKYQTRNINAKAGLNIHAELSKDISLLGKIYLNYQGLSFENKNNDISFLRSVMDFGVLLFKSRRTKILFSYGILPYDFRENVNFFLEQGRPFGTIYHWNDTNGDSTFQLGEEGQTYGQTGGRYHYASQDLIAPLKERLLLHFTTPLGKQWTLNIKGIYKRIKNPLRIKFDNEYGFYEPHNNENIYFFTQPFTNYYLTNGGYEKDPFYAQFYFDISKRKENHWIFYFSFMAHMGMGDTAFGNGPGSNDIGIIDESQANPNSWINGFGRLDGDRGFVAKSYFGYYLSKRLYLAISLKYRDGNPFAFMNTVSKYNQYVIYYNTIKAENEKGVKGGPREDYLADVNFKLSYNFKLFNKDAILSLSFFNILDFGGELSEYVFSGGARDAVELQIPRSLRLTFSWRF